MLKLACDVVATGIVKLNTPAGYINFGIAAFKRQRISHDICIVSLRSYFASAMNIGNQMDANEIDLRSDTLTKPTNAMREAMAKAVVGDQCYDEDPTVKALEEKSAALLGMEAALFVPSGTMSNLIAAMVHCHRRGSEMIAGDLSHMFLYEQAGVAQFGGIQTNLVPNLPDGTFDLVLMKQRIRVREMHEPYTSLVCVENTHNKCGGKVLPLSWLDQLVASCKENDLPLHMDGARLYNAVVYLSVPPSRITQGFSSVSVCLSKGLASPVGSLLHGSKDFIAKAKRVAKALGGVMRQSGVLAAAGIVSLDHMVQRLKDDHSNAQLLAQGMANLKHPKFHIDVAGVETNIIIFKVDPHQVDVKDFCDKLQVTTEDQRSKLDGQAVCVKAVPFESKFVRMVLHNDVTRDMVKLALRKISIVISQY